MKTISIRFGPAVICVGGDAAEVPLLETLAGWSGRHTNAGLDAADICIEVSARRRRDSDELSDQATERWWDGKAWDAAPRSSVGGGVLWPVSIHESALVRVMGLLPQWLVRWAHVHRFDHNEILASALLYGHVLPAAQVALRRRGATLVHASAISTAGGEAVLILGRGGAGKTSASTHMYVRHPEIWRYMSDDLAVIDRNGILYRSPVPLNVFPYNTDRFPELWDLLATGMSAADRLHWMLRHRLLGLAGVARRRAPFAAYLGPPTATIRHVVEVRRMDIPEPSVELVDEDVVAREARDVLAHELRRGFSGMEQARSRLAEIEEPTLNPSAMLDDAEQVMKGAFAAARLRRIYLPRSATVEVAGKTLESVLADA